jgi:hypothetical protein
MGRPAALRPGRDPDWYGWYRYPPAYAPGLVIGSFVEYSTSPRETQRDWCWSCF